MQGFLALGVIIGAFSLAVLLGLAFKQPWAANAVLQGEHFFEVLVSLAGPIFSSGLGVALTRANNGDKPMTWVTFTGDMAMTFLGAIMGGALGQYLQTPEIVQWALAGSFAVLGVKTFDIVEDWIRHKLGIDKP